MIRRLLPHPALSAAIFLLWAALSNAASVGALAVGALLAVLLPALTRPFWPDAPRLQPAFVEVPLDLRDPFAATILASIVSLTPGTVSIDVDQTRWVLSLHALDAPDPQALVAAIKAHYEAPLKEVFAC